MTPHTWQSNERRKRRRNARRRRQRRNARYARPRPARPPAKRRPAKKRRPARKQRVRRPLARRQRARLRLAKPPVKLLPAARHAKQPPAGKRLSQPSLSGIFYTRESHRRLAFFLRTSSKLRKKSPHQSRGRFWTLSSLLISHNATALLLLRASKSPKNRSADIGTRLFPQPARCFARSAQRSTPRE